MLEIDWNTLPRMCQSQTRVAAKISVSMFKITQLHTRIHKTFTVYNMYVFVLGGGVGERVRGGIMLGVVRMW